MSMRLLEKLLVLVLAVAAGCGGSGERGTRVSIELFPGYARAQGGGADIFALHPPRAASWMLPFEGKTHPHAVVRAAMASGLRPGAARCTCTSCGPDAGPPP